MSVILPNHALQRLERSGKTVKGISLHRMKRKAGGRVCWAAHESHCNRRERRGCVVASLLVAPQRRAKTDGPGRCLSAIALATLEALGTAEALAQAEAWGVKRPLR